MPRTPRPGCSPGWITISTASASASGKIWRLLSTTPGGRHARHRPSACPAPEPGRTTRTHVAVPRRLEGMPPALYAAQRDADARITLAEQPGLSARDCHAVATILAAREMTAEALGRAERGIEMDRADSRRTSAAFDLREPRRDLLVKPGRDEEAPQSTWAGFGRNPGTCAYGDLMKLVPVNDRASWHEKAIDTAAQPGRCALPSLIPLLAETKEIRRLAGLVGQCTADQLEQTSHYTLEPAAETLDDAYPGPAARLWCAMALRIADAGKSKYYRAALDSFQRARRSSGAAGLQPNWEEIAGRARASHSRKTGFMRGFEEIAACAEPEPAPAFPEKAKARWAPPPSRQVQAVTARGTPSHPGSVPAGNHPRKLRCPAVDAAGTRRRSRRAQRAARTHPAGSSCSLAEVTECDGGRLSNRAPHRRSVSAMSVDGLSPRTRRTGQYARFWPVRRGKCREYLPGKIARLAGNASSGSTEVTDRHEFRPVLAAGAKVPDTTLAGRGLTPDWVRGNVMCPSLPV